jgi:hypothetical protein
VFYQLPYHNEKDELKQLKKVIVGGKWALWGSELTISIIY